MELKRMFPWIDMSQIPNVDFRTSILIVVKKLKLQTQDGFMETVMDTVTEYFGITKDLVRLKRRFRDEVVIPRQICWWLIKKYRDVDHKDHITSSTMGEYLGGHDHSTALHGIKTINNLIDPKTGNKEVMLHVMAIDKIFVEKMNGSLNPQNTNQNEHSNTERTMD